MPRTAPPSWTHSLCRPRYAHWCMCGLAQSFMVCMAQLQVGDELDFEKFLVTIELEKNARSGPVAVPAPPAAPVTHRSSPVLFLHMYLCASELHLLRRRRLHEFRQQSNLSSAPSLFLLRTQHSKITLPRSMWSSKHRATLHPR